MVKVLVTDGGGVYRVEPDREVFLTEKGNWGRPKKSEGFNE